MQFYFLTGRTDYSNLSIQNQWIFSLANDDETGSLCYWIYIELSYLRNNTTVHYYGLL